jgi:hypothetical protein
MGEPCIEFKSPFADRSLHVSVSEYEDAQRRVGSLSPRAITFHGVGWASGTPPVSRLSSEWQTTEGGRLRITDRRLYDQQMRILLGLD